MALAIFEARATQAKTLLEQVTQRVATLRKTLEAKEIQRLKEENAKLSAEIEQKKQQIYKAQAANGKIVIVPLPGSTATVVAAAAATSTTTTTATQPPTAIPATEKPKPAAPKQAAAAASPKEPAAKKEEKTKDAKPAKAAAAATEEESPVDVGRIDFRIGKIIEVSNHPNADSLYLEKIDVGEKEPRTVLSGLVKFVPIDQLKDRMIVLCANLKPKAMRGIESHGMLMCASTPEAIEPIIPPAGSVPGDVVEFEGYTCRPDAQLNPKKNVLETVLADLKVNEAGIAVYKKSAFTIAGKGPCTSKLIGAPIK